MLNALQHTGLSLEISAEMACIELIVLQILLTLVVCQACMLTYICMVTCSTDMLNRDKPDQA